MILKLQSEISVPESTYLRDPILPSTERAGNIVRSYEELVLPDKSQKQ
jgi:hypothetical protein